MLHRYSCFKLTKVKGFGRKRRARHAAPEAMTVIAPISLPPRRGTLRTGRRRAIKSTGGGGRIRTYEGVSRQIYSLLPLAAWVPLREKRAAYSDFHTRRCQCRIRA